MDVVRRVAIEQYFMSMGVTTFWKPKHLDLIPKRLKEFWTFNVSFYVKLNYIICQLSFKVNADTMFS